MQKHSAVDSIALEAIVSDAAFNKLHRLLQTLGSGDCSVVEQQTRDRKVPGSSPATAAGEFSSPRSFFSVLTLTAVSVTSLRYRSST